jgi:hypothetical protein
MGSCIGLILDLGRGTPAGEMLNVADDCIVCVDRDVPDRDRLLACSTMAVEPFR